MALTDTNVNTCSPIPENKLSTNLCRVCMAHNTEMKCVFRNETFRIIEQFEFCTGILISKEDGLPTKLCEICFTNLSIAHKFKSSCLRSDELFRKTIKKQKDVKMEVEIEETVKVENQGSETKQEVDTDDDDDDLDNDDDEFLCNIPPNSRSRTRLAQKAKQNQTKIKTDKNTLARIKKKITKGKREIKTKKKNDKDTDLDPKEERLKKLKCSLCDIKFNNTEEQIQHRKDKHGGCEWICEICGKTFKHRTTHYSHVRSHLPPKYQCDQCDYKTCHKGDINKHLKLHEGKKDYVCEYCTKSFCTVSQLRHHIRQNHTDKKKLACPRCGRLFHQPSKLRLHLDTHDNIKRYECELCKDRFLRRRQWKIHLTKMHNVSVPKARPGLSKSSILVGVKDPANRTDSEK